MEDTPQSRQDRVVSIRNLFVSLMWIAHRQFSQSLQVFDLTRPQFITLHALVAHNQPCPMRDLTDVTFQDAPTMTGIVDRLIKMGLAERTRSKIDRRVVLVQATTAGADLAKQVDEKSLEDDMCGYAALTDEELNALEQLATYILRMYMQRYMAAQNGDMNEVMEKIKLFRTDPIFYARLHNEKTQHERIEPSEPVETMKVDLPEEMAVF